MPNARIQNFFGQRRGGDYLHFAGQIEEHSQNCLAVMSVCLPLPQLNPQNIDEFYRQEIRNEDLNETGFQTLEQQRSHIGIFFLEEQFKDYVRVNNELRLKVCHAAS